MLFTGGMADTIAQAAENALAALVKNATGCVRSYSKGDLTVQLEPLGDQIKAVQALQELAARQTAAAAGTIAQTVAEVC